MVWSPGCVSGEAQCRFMDVNSTGQNKGMKKSIGRVGVTAEKQKRMLLILRAQAVDRETTIYPKIERGWILAQIESTVGVFLSLFLKGW